MVAALVLCEYGGGTRVRGRNCVFAFGCFLCFFVTSGASARSSSGILSEFRVSKLRDAASDVSVGFVLLVVLDGVLAAEMHELGV